MKPFVTGSRSGVITATLMALTCAAPAMAQSVDSVIRAENTRLDRQKQSQTRIDRIVEQTRSVTDEFRAVNKEIDGLKIYNQLLQAQISRQTQKLNEIEVSMQNATVVNRQILPLITRMIAGLETSISLDIPFLMRERTERLDNLKAIIEDPGVTTAEKFRKAMEAYSIEVDYGRTIESYEDTITIGSDEISARFLRLGRIALLFQNGSGDITGRYNPDTKSFEIANEYRAEVAKGLAVAAKQIAPELLLVPVSGPESN